MNTVKSFAELYDSRYAGVGRVEKLLRFCVGLQE